MIIGYAKVMGGMLQTHRDDYVLSSLKVVSTRRPFLAPAIIFSFALLCFTVSFFDLLYAGEIATILTLSCLAVLVASQVGQLRLLSRELNGNELSGAVWGQISDLKRVRSDIAAQLDPSRMGDFS